MICTVALEGAIQGASGFEARFGESTLRLKAHEIQRVTTMTNEEAIRECARATAYARSRAVEDEGAAVPRP